MELKELNLNLDSYINPDQLQETAIELDLHPRLYARKYFPGEDHAVKAIKSLVAYAWNESTAMKLRLEGNINDAMKYESICTRIYNQLPAYAAW